MTWEHLCEIFFELHMFDGSRASCVLLRGHDDLLFPSGSGKPQNPPKKIQEPFSRSHRIDQNCRQTISENYIRNIPRAFWRKKIFLSNFCFVICHLTGRFIWTCTEMVAILSWFRVLFCPWLGTVTRGGVFDMSSRLGPWEASAWDLGVLRIFKFFALLLRLTINKHSQIQKKRD